jgi:hypothetical protein
MCYHRAMAPRAVALRWLLLFLTLALFGVVPAGTQLIVDSPPEAWPLLESEARGRAELLDCRLERWQLQAQDRAREMSALLAQLPQTQGRLGKAVEGTLLLYLQRKLAETTEISEYSVLTARGDVMISSSGRRGGRLAEAATGVERPAAMLLRAEKDTRLVVAAPIQLAAKIGGAIVAHPAPAIVARLLDESGHGQINLVDANGLVLGAGRASELVRLGSESGAGRTRLEQGPAAYAPLRTFRAVVVAAAPATRGPWSRRLIGLGGVLVLAGLAAWLLIRSGASSAR